MQWEVGKNLGFSTAAPEKLYLPVDTAMDAPNAASQEKDENSLLNRTRRLIKLRHTEKALSAYAEFIPLFAKENEYPFIYARAKDKDVVLVVLNPSEKECSATFDVNIPFTELKLLAGEEFNVSKDGNKVMITVPARKYAIYKLL
jgi:maltose alpha-D-glucosyltransferase/alpha-amylase